MTSLPACGFIGLGTMGARMAMRLASADVPLTVWNRGPGTSDALAAAGAQVARNAAAVAREADVVFLCLADSGAVEAVAFGPEGLAEGAAPGKIVVDFSSAAPEATRALARRMYEACGATWVDAPVTGGPLAAEQGSLALLCGGDSADLDRLAPLFAHLSSKVTHFGPVGAGQAAKLCNQILAGTAMLACVEAVALAECTGVDPHRLAAAIENGFASSPVTRLALPRIASRAYEPPVGTIALILKDLKIVLTEAARAGVSLPLTAVATDTFARAADAGFGPKEFSALIERYSTSPTGNTSSSV